MQPEPPAFFPQLCQRFHALVWACLDAELTRSAVFYAERYYTLDSSSHDACHLYATALLREGQTYSALNLVVTSKDVTCSGCLEIKSKCLNALGRHREARGALEYALEDANYTPTTSMSTRDARPFPDEAALRCRSGIMALKGNIPSLASHSFRQALALNPFLWEAFEGLCAMSPIPTVDDIFPPHPSPIKRAPPEEFIVKAGPIATGVGFFTPDTGNAGNLFRPLKQEPPQRQPLRMGPPPPREAPHRPDSYYAPEIRPANVRAGRPTPATSTTIPAQPASRQLSSADEAGPAPKRLRSTARLRDAGPLPKVSKPIKEEPLQKARVRAPSKLTKFSVSRPTQPVATSRTAAGPAKGNIQPLNAAATRRSTRLLSGTGTKQTHAAKNQPIRDRRRPLNHARSQSIELEPDEDAKFGDPLGRSSSPPEVSPSPSNWTAAHEQAAQDAYDQEMADQYLYDLTRQFARATRALSMYDSDKCLEYLDELPYCHQHSAWVLSMVGKAHYEKLEYAAAERAFQAVRAMEPYRLWDMEIYSTLLWHLQRNVQLSFLAQELLNIDPKSPQAWIAVGNLFSLQKERSQALTCFRRAVQLDPTCAYAYTLSGHESIDEDLDKAINFFQTALRADPRHYNAWYGLGTCYLRMSKVRQAEYHYRRAADIHPHNAVLIGCVGMAVERRGDEEAALALFDEAVRLSPDNALGRYRRAKILIAMKRYWPAIEDLERLRGSTPEESNVVFQLAKAYRLVGDEVKAAQLLAVARDISPKSLGKIKKLLETVKDEEVQDDPMDEG